MCSEPTKIKDGSKSAPARFLNFAKVVSYYTNYYFLCLLCKLFMSRQSTMNSTRFSVICRESYHSHNLVVWSTEANTSTRIEDLKRITRTLEGLWKNQERVEAEIKCRQLNLWAGKQIKDAVHSKRFREDFAKAHSKTHTDQTIHIIQTRFVRALKLLSGGMTSLAQVWRNQNSL